MFSTSVMVAASLSHPVILHRTFADNHLRMHNWYLTPRAV